MKNINATKRSKSDKLETIRKNGMVPAVVYGARVENTSISVPSVAFDKVFREAGESSTIVLDLEGTKIDVLIHDVQMEPVKGFPLHIDFLAIDMNKPIEVEVAIEFTGVAPAEKGGIGSLVKALHEVTVRALPKNLPHSIVADISSLATLEDQIHVRDLAIPSGVEVLTGADEVVALVAAQREEPEEPAAPVDLGAIEVEKKGKKEEEGAVEAAA